jgi:hypothetical protein
VPETTGGPLYLGPYINMTEKDAETYMSGKTCVISGNLDWCLMIVVRYDSGVPEEC